VKLELRNITKKFGDFTAVDDIDLDLDHVEAPGKGGDPGQGALE